MRVYEDSEGRIMLTQSGGMLAVPADGQVDELVVGFVVSDGRIIATFGEVPVSPTGEGRVDYLISLHGLIEGDPAMGSLMVRNVQQGTFDIGPAERIAPFLTANYSRMLVAVQFEGATDVVPVRRIRTSPARPGRVSFQAVPGDEGEIDVTLNTPLPSAGDSTVPGNGLGGALTLEYRTGGSAGAIATLGDGVVEAGVVKTITGLEAGVLTPVDVRATSAYGSGPWTRAVVLSGQAVVVPPVPPVAIPQAAINAVAGNTLTLDFSTMFTGAVSYAATGIDGATVGGAGNKDWSKVLEEGSFTLQVVGTSAEALDASLTISITVAAAPVAPVWVSSALPDIVVAEGALGTVTRNLRDYITAGSEPMTFASPQDAGSSRFAIDSASGVQTSVLGGSPFATFQVEVVATNSAGSSSAFFDLGVVANPPPPLEVGVDVFVESSSYAYGGQKWRKPNTRAPGLLANHRLEWSTGTPDAVTGLIPENQWEIHADPVSGIYVPLETTPELRGDPDTQSPRTDFSAYSTELAATAGRYRVRQVSLSTGLKSLPSGTMNIPLVSALYPTGSWRIPVMRKKASFDANVVGNTGQQFERVVCWNQGRNDPDKIGHIFFGQDENNLWACHNGTSSEPALVGSPRQEGMMAKNVGGAYANSDDNVILCSIGENNAQGSGLYRSTDWGATFRRLNLVRTGLPDHTGSTTAFRRNVNGSGLRGNQNCLTARPQNAAGTLPLNQRPVYAVEQVMGAGEVAMNVFIWRSLDAGATWTCLTELTPATTYVGTSKQHAFRYITAAPNGDLLLVGGDRSGSTVFGGVWRSQADGNGLAGTTWTKCSILGDTTTQRAVKGVGWRGGSPTTVSGAYISIDSTSAGGVVRTDNIRTTGFTRPAGQTANIATMPGLHLGVSPANTNRMVMIGSSVAPRLSTDGGVTWTTVSDIAGSGDGAGRYQMRNGASGVYFHPTMENVCFATTNQTMSRSINGGASFNGDLVAYFDGSHDKGWGFDGEGLDPLAMCFMQQDYGLRYTNNGFDYFYDSQVNRNLPTTHPETGAATTVGVVLEWMSASNNWQYTSGQGAARIGDNRFIVAMNRNSASGRNGLILCENPRPESSTPNDATDIGEMQTTLLKATIGTTRVRMSYPHPTNHDVMYMGRFRVSNLRAPTLAGVQFTNMVRGICKIYELNGTTISYWIADSSDGTQIYRATTELGDEQSLWFTTAASHKTGAVCPDVFQTERVLYARSGEDARIRQIRRVGGVLTDSILFDIKVNRITPYLTDLFGAGQYIDPPGTVSWIVQDPNMPGIFYCSLAQPGMPTVFRSVDDGATWEDITDDMPRTSTELAINPLTGDLVAMGSKGRRVLPPPDIPGYPVWPNRGLLTQQCDDYLKIPGVPRPPVF